MLPYLVIILEQLLGNPGDTGSNSFLRAGQDLLTQVYQGDLVVRLSRHLNIINNYNFISKYQELGDQASRLGKASMRPPTMTPSL